jgi:hypothetical protein
MAIGLVITTYHKQDPATAATAAQKATHELQEKVAMQLNAANNKVHQAEAKLLAVRYKTLLFVHMTLKAKGNWQRLI